MLTKAREQEIELGLEGRTRPLLVEIFEKGIVHVLEHFRALEVSREHLDQGGLAGPDGAIHGQVAIGEGILAHTFLSYRFSRPRRP